MPLSTLLAIVADGQSLTADQARAAVLAIMAGSCPEAQVAAFLTALRVRGETADELVGAAGALRERSGPKAVGVSGLLDTCGTGGDGSATFNVSTAAAIVASACGVPVAKHGNRSVSSTSGSADVLSALGVNIEADANVVLDCLRQIGLGFFFAPKWHPAMKQAMPVRRALGFRTIFNLVGPLSNPASADFQLVGVGRSEWTTKLAEALLRLGTRSATVVAGEDGLDEVTLAGRTSAVCVRDGALLVETWTAESFGLPRYRPNSWRVSSARDSAQVIRKLLDGRPGPSRDLVLANTAAALWTAGKVADLVEGVRLAAQAIDSGAAQRQLDELARRTSQLP